jgi:hypothetical protein
MLLIKCTMKKLWENQTIHAMTCYCNKNKIARSSYRVHIFMKTWKLWIPYDIDKKTFTLIPHIFTLHTTTTNHPFQKDQKDILKNWPCCIVMWPTMSFGIFVAQTGHVYFPPHTCNYQIYSNRKKNEYARNI